MKAVMTSTDTIIDVIVAAPHGGKTAALARVWEGVTENGAKFTAYIPLTQVHKSQDQTEFDRDLKESKRASLETFHAINMRNVL